MSLTKRQRIRPPLPLDQRERYGSPTIGRSRGKDFDFHSLRIKIDRKDLNSEMPIAVVFNPFT